MFENVDAIKIFEEVLKENANINVLKNQFQFPNGIVLEYDVLAPKNKWVIVSEDGKKLNRDFDSWPLIEGDL